VTVRTRPVSVSASALAQEPAGLADLVPRRDPNRRTRVVGILNVTPDSFHDGGADPTPLAAAERARAMVDAGADALDVGAESTRPGADPVSAAAELARLLPVLDRLRGLGVPVSVDTTKADVAARAIEHGATLVNDVSGLQNDPGIADVCAAAGAGLVLMHRRGDARTMRSLARYDDVVAESRRFLAEAVERAVRSGVAEDRIVVDPGLGFAKNASHNLEILRRLTEYLDLGRPVLVGASRKSFLAPFDAPTTDDRLAGTLAATVLAVLGGASLVRVHDVRENKRAILVAEAVLSARGEEERTEGAAC
jgi:dihydropteroate synthase